MADTIPMAKQQELCDVLNTQYPVSGLTWFPDPSAIPGGIEAHGATRVVWRVRRDRGRIRVMDPRDCTLATMRGVTVGRGTEFDGAGWVPKFAAALASYIMAQPPATP